MKRILALAAAGIILAGCESGPKIRANTAPGANLQAYKTYTFAKPLGTDRGGVETPLSGYFKEATRREMDARGYQYVDSGDADLLVNFGANAQEKTDIRSTPSMTMGYGGYYGYRGGMYGAAWSTSDVETVRYQVGTANIDVVDLRKKQLVWEGLVEGKLTKKALEDPRGAVNLVVTEIFKQFPGGAGGAPPATGTSS
jgi:hypothetical protein